MDEIQGSIAFLFGYLSYLIPTDDNQIKILIEAGEIGLRFRLDEIRYYDDKKTLITRESIERTRSPLLRMGSGAVQFVKGRRGSIQLMSLKGVEHLRQNSLG